MQCTSTVDERIQMLERDLMKCHRALEKQAVAIELLSSTNATLVARNESFLEENSKLRDEKVELRESAMSNSVGASGENISRHCFELFQEASLKEEKRENLVIIGASESLNEEETAKDNEALAHEICVSCGVPVSDVTKTYRHGLRREGRARTLKIKFANKLTPAIVLQTMEERYLLKALRQHSIIRRDLTFSEQLRERDARREAYKRNVDDGVFRWIVNRDFEFVQLHNDLPWRSQRELERSEANDELSEEGIATGQRR